MTKRTRLVLTGGRKPHQRKAGARNWSLKKTEEFLSVLAETCNVTEACRQTGISTTAAYTRRKRDAGFRAGWNGALATAYRRLELVLLERAFNGTEKLVRHKDGSEERVREYSDTLGLTLLRMHQARAVEADAQSSPAEADEVRKRVLAKLKRLRERFEAEDAVGDGVPA